MGWWLRRRARQDESVADRLAEEPQAFLEGRYLEYLQSHRRLVPVWAWLNPAAHLDREALEGLARRSPEASNGWGLASYLAAEVLTAADRDSLDVREVQRRHLVPLELELHRRSGTAAAPRRTELAALVATALDQRARS